MPEQTRVSWPHLLLAAALVAFGFVGTAPASTQQGLAEPGALAYVLVVIAGASVVVLRWRPWWTFILAGSAIVAYIALGYGNGPILITGMVAIYGLTSQVPLRRAAAGVAVVLLGVVVASVIRVQTAADPDAYDYVTTVPWVLIPAAIGAAVRIRRESAREVREAEARTAVSEERLRMAQEIHDTVGHGLAVIAMQAGVALHVLEREPGKARESLEAIRSTSRHSLDDLRAELDELRGMPGDSPQYQPSVGLADVPALAERIRLTGLPVVVTMDGVDDRQLTPDVGLAAYRIVQESLTNVLRHAGSDASAQVVVSCDGHEIDLEIRDDGRGADDDTNSGHGIAGMRHRAERLGGTFEAGPVATGGYRVYACLPMTGSAP